MTAIIKSYKYVEKTLLIQRKQLVASLSPAWLASFEILVLWRYCSVRNSDFESHTMTP